jgi:uncharacterized repeat protein (TIGR03803 family)
MMNRKSGTRRLSTLMAGALVLAAVAAAQPAGYKWIYSFPGAAGGAAPTGGVVRDPAGNLYGTTSTGGAGCNGYGCGVIFELDAVGSYTVLHTFGGPDGSNPEAGVIRDAAGTLYGDTYLGGPHNAGVVFKLSPAGKLTVLYNFTGGLDGKSPVADLVRDAEGNLYGTTLFGGENGLGVIFKLDPAGNLSTLHSFKGADGANPQTALLRDAAGNLYGSASGGSGNVGVIFMLDAAGVFSTLYNFTGKLDGASPGGGLIRDSEGNLYGTTYYGGVKGLGVVYKLDPAGNLTTLHSFTGRADGGGPRAGVIRDPAGNLYGTANSGGEKDGGVIFMLDPAGQLTVLHNFSSRRGVVSQPFAGLTGVPGYLYGTSAYGGANGYGMIFRLH